MKISVVTISYNQSQFLTQCLDSVASQDGPWEHIVVDPGSTDGSREIIEQHRRQFSKIIFENDAGPADGLNKGFAEATGDIFFYLNSDDIVLPGAFAEARAYLRTRTHIDVLSGHGHIIDEQGQFVRKVHSDPVSRHRLAHGGGIRIQPATYIRKEIFERIGGFNADNRSNWDGELIVDMFLAGGKFAVLDRYWAGYRLHDLSITATGKLDQRMKTWDERRHKKLLGRPKPANGNLARKYYALERVIRHPSSIGSRLTGKTVYGARRKK